MVPAWRRYNFGRLIGGWARRTDVLAVRWKLSGLLSTARRSWTTAPEIASHSLARACSNCIKINMLGIPSFARAAL
jgi:hypothetical protein